ncbi:MAG: thiamine diphosphokinase [Ruminococcus sp.]
MKQAVIFAGASVQPEQQPPVPAADLYVCADAGVKLAQALGVVPDWIVGDFDSLGSVPEGENVEPFSPMKDDTDILLAAKYALSKGCRRLVFYGALGGRLDHTVANLQMLRFLADHGAQVCWLTMPTGSHSSVAERQFIPDGTGCTFPCLP